MLTELPDEIVEAIDDVVESLMVEPDEREAFGEAARRLCSELSQWQAEAEDDRWPLTLLADLEAECGRRVLTDPVWVERAAAVATIIDFLKSTHAEQASMN